VSAPRRRRTQLAALDDRQIIALIYGRLSKAEMAKKSQSIPAQFEECRAYDARHTDWIAGDEFQDVETGTRADRRGYQQLLLVIRGHVAAGRRVVLTVAHIDRLGRNLIESARAWEELRKLGVELHAVRNGGRLSEEMYGFLAVMAQSESRRIGERVRGVWEYFELKGWHRPGRPAWGYKYRPATDEERMAGSPKSVLVPHETEAAYAAELWSRYAGGQAAEALTRWIAGLPAAARGRRTLRESALRSLLASPVYIGRHGGPHDLAACVEEDARCAVLDEPRGRWVPLIDDDTWEAAHQQYRRLRRLPAQASGTYLLTGVIRCPACGERMTGNPGNRARAARDRYRGDPAGLRRYICQSRKSGDLAVRQRPCYATVLCRKVDAAVITSVRGLIEAATDPVLRQKMQASARLRLKREQGGDVGGRITSLESQLRQAKTDVATASQKWFHGQMIRLAYDATVAELAEQIEALESEIERLRTSRARPDVLPLSAVLAVADSWAGLLDRAEPEDWRPIIAAMCQWVRPIKEGRGRYRVGFEPTPFCQGLLDYVCEVTATPEMVALRRLATANYPTATLTTPALTLRVASA